MPRKSLSRQSLSRKTMTRKSMSRKSVSRKSFSKTTKKVNVGTKGKKDKRFEEADVTIPTLDPFFILLKCKEPPVILRAVEAIYERVKCVPEEVPMIIENDIMDALKVYSQASELAFIPLRSMKLIAELSQYPEAFDPITSDENFIRFVYKTYAENNDMKWKEPASFILSETTKNLEFCQAFVNEIADLSVVIKSQKAHDPDVVHNTLKLISNLFQDHSLAQKYVNTTEFMFDTLFPLYESLYIEIQKLSLDITYWLVYQDVTEALKKLFLDEQGVDKMYNILLNKFAWRDLHPLALDILQITLNDEERVAALKEEGVRKLVLYLDFIEDDELISKAMTVVAQWSRMIFGRFMLLRLGMMDKCIDMLTDGTDGMKIAACTLLDQICLEREKLRKLCHGLPMQTLLDLMSNSGNPWDLVTAAHTLFNNLIKFSRDEIALYCQKPLVKDQLGDWILQTYETSKTVNKRLMLNTISILSQNSQVRPAFIDFPMISFLVRSMKDYSKDLYDVTIVAAEAMYHLLKNEPNACQYVFLRGDLESILNTLYNTKNDLLRDLICQFLAAAVINDEFIKLTLIKSNCLYWVTKNKDLWYKSPGMKILVQTIFNHYLPVKFAFCSRLGFEDKINDGFYAYKENRPPNTLPFPCTPDEVHDLSVYMVGFNERMVLNEKIITEQDKTREVQDDRCIELLKLYPQKTYWHPLGYRLDKDLDYIEKTVDLTIHWCDDFELQKYADLLDNRLHSIEHEELNRLMEEFKTTSSVIKGILEEPFKPLQPGDMKSLTQGVTTRAALERAEAKKQKIPEFITTMRKPGDLPPPHNLLSQGKRKTIVPIVEFKEDSKDSKFAMIPKPFSAEWIVSRVEIVSDIVNDMMSGQTSQDPCSYHTFNLFLAELKKTLNSNIVPFGLLKVGMKFERALLFKILADRIDLPCTLVRGNKGQSWNEVCVMKLDDENRGIAKMPRRLLYPTHVVDLWTKPGRLMPIGNREAEKYCGEQKNPLTYIKEDWMVN